MFKFFQKKLSWTILSILALALALPLIILVFFSASYQARNMISEMTTFGHDIFHTVYQGIQYPMAKGDSAAVRSQMVDMNNKLKDVSIFICNNDQEIIYSTKEDMIGQTIKSSVVDSSIWNELVSRKNSREELTKSLEETNDGKKYLTTVHLIRNKSKCHECHGSKKEILGGMVVQMATDRTYNAIMQYTRNNLILGLLGITLIVLVFYFLLFKLVTEPIKKLAGYIKNLPEELEEEQLEPREVVIREDEIGCLEKNFYKMRKEIREKNEAIRIANEELMTSNKELEAFAYSVSHDLRAPLRNIDGFSKILLDEHSDKLDGQGKNFLNRVRNGTVKMSHLIDDMLSFSRAGRKEMQNIKIDTNKIVNECLRDFTQSIREKDIDVTVDEMPEIFGDMSMIQHIFSNLISNAVKYTRETKHPKISIGYNAKDKAFYIKDNGIGFDTKYNDKIFQIFQRLHLPEEYEGTGVGLAIVQRLVERHKGEIWAESEPGHGSTFYLRLPLNKQAQLT